MNFNKSKQSRIVKEWVVVQEIIPLINKLCHKWNKQHLANIYWPSTFLQLISFKLNFIANVKLDNNEKPYKLIKAIKPHLTIFNYVHLRILI